MEGAAEGRRRTWRTCGKGCGRSASMATRQQLTPLLRPPPHEKGQDQEERPTATTTATTIAMTGGQVGVERLPVRPGARATVGPAAPPPQPQVTHFIYPTL